jgi:hypothetical protein
VRILSALALIVCLAGCHRGQQSNDAVRQAVVEYLQGRQLNVASMEISVSAVKYNGDQADATVSFAAKGADPASSGMSIQYHLELKSGKWSVVSHQDVGGAPHGGGKDLPGAAPGGPPPSGDSVAPAGANPHGAAMPSPDSLPPAGKK